MQLVTHVFLIWAQMFLLSNLVDDEKQVHKLDKICTYYSGQYFDYRIIFYLNDIFKYLMTDETVENSHWTDEWC